MLWANLMCIVVGFILKNYKNRKNVIQILALMIEDRL